MGTRREIPVVLVHGGGHAKWSFEQHAPVLRDGGYEVQALDWLNHGDARRLPEDQFLRRGIDDVAREELSYVVERLGRPPIVIGHSMGAMAALVYAASNPVERLVLLTPVVPSAVGADPIELEVDLTKPFGPVPYDVARLLFFPLSTRTSPACTTTCWSQSHRGRCGKRPVGRSMSISKP